MINLLKPYAVYVFVKLKGIIQVEVFTVQMDDSSWWADVVQHHEPKRLLEVKLPKYKRIWEAISKKQEEGWKLDSFNIAYLSPEENKPGVYEDKIGINILQHEHRENTSNNTDDKTDRTTPKR